MKKLMMAFAAVLCCATLFTSCQKSGDSSNQPQEDNTPAFVAFKFSCAATQDMLDYTNVVITYNDGTEEKTENMNELVWSKTLKVALPCDITYSRTISLKENVQLTDDITFAYSSGFLVSYQILNATGKALPKSGTTGATTHHSAKGTKAARIIADGTLNITDTFKFDKNGNLGGE